MKTKKVLSVILVALMAFVLSGMTAFAASITVESTATEGTDETEYTYYQILKATVDGKKVAYYVDDETQATALAGVSQFKVTKVVSGNYWTVELADGVEDNEATQKAIATALDGIKDKFTASAAFKAGEAQEVDDGYYLVTSTLGTLVIVDTFKTETIQEKNEYPSITKSVDDPTVAIGDEVTFTVEVVIPKTAGAYDIVITDTADAGLALDTAVTVAGAADSFKSTTISGGKITIPAANVKANAGKTLTLTYKATITAAIIADTTKPVNSATNTVQLKYSGFTSEKASATVSTYAVMVCKQDETGSELEGAKFSIYDAATAGNKITVKVKDGNYYVDPDGSAVIEVGTATIFGLDKTEYFLQEDEAPAGYNRIADRKSANLSQYEDDARKFVTVTIENKAGTELPSTGAMGTTIFYVVGVLAILGAGVFMVTNKRIAKEDF